MPVTIPGYRGVTVWTNPSGAAWRWKSAKSRPQWLPWQIKTSWWRGPLDLSEPKSHWKNLQFLPRHSPRERRHIASLLWSWSLSSYWRCRGSYSHCHCHCQLCQLAANRSRTAPTFLEWPFHVQVGDSIPQTWEKPGHPNGGDDDSVGVIRIHHEFPLIHTAHTPSLEKKNLMQLGHMRISVNWFRDCVASRAFASMPSASAKLAACSPTKPSMASEPSITRICDVSRWQECHRKIPSGYVKIAIEAMAQSK